MAPVDRFFDDQSLPSARYVDDMYVFVKSLEEAEALLRRLIPFLRGYDLNLNEVKSAVYPKSTLFVEEPDLENLFSQAVEEITAQLEGGDVSSSSYGFQDDWEGDEEESGDDGGNDEEIDLELKATQALFDAAAEFKGHEEEIERFCLPLFTQADSDYAVEYVLAHIRKRPSMTQIYAAYLGRFVRDSEEVRGKLTEAAGDASFFDWQRMWLVAALIQARKADNAAMKGCCANIGLCGNCTTVCELLQHYILAASEITIGENRYLKLTGRCLSTFNCRYTILHFGGPLSNARMQGTAGADIRRCTNSCPKHWHKSRASQPTSPPASAHADRAAASAAGRSSASPRPVRRR